MFGHPRGVGSSSARLGQAVPRCDGPGRVAGRLIMSKNSKGSTCPDVTSRLRRIARERGGKDCCPIGGFLRSATSIHRSRFGSILLSTCIFNFNTSVVLPSYVGVKGLKVVGVPVLLWRERVGIYFCSILYFVVLLSFCVVCRFAIAYTTAVVPVTGRFGDHCNCCSCV